MCRDHTQQPWVLAPTQDLVGLRLVFALYQKEVVPGTLASALVHPQAQARLHPASSPTSLPACALEKSPCQQGGFSAVAGCSPMEDTLRAFSWTLGWGLPTRTYVVCVIGESACQYQWP